MVTEVSLDALYLAELQIGVHSTIGGLEQIEDPVMHIYHKVSHPLNVELAQDYLELNFLIVQPKNLFFWNGLGCDGGGFLCLLRLLNHLKPLRVYRLNHGRGTFVGVRQDLLLRLLRRFLLRI
jgi:hypothetical protein